MDRLDLKWSKLLNLTEEVILANIAANQPAVYRLSNKNSEGQFIVFYVAQTDDLKRDLMEYIKKTGGNKCVRERIAVMEDIKVRYAIIEDEKIRGGVVKYLYNYYVPACNLEEPKSDLDILSISMS